MKNFCLILILSTISFSSVALSDTNPMNGVVQLMNTKLQGHGHLHYRPLPNKAQRIALHGIDGNQVLAHRLEFAVWQNQLVPAIFVSERTGKKFDLRPYLSRLAELKISDVKSIVGANTSNPNTQKVQAIAREMSAALIQYMQTEIGGAASLMNLKQGRLPARVHLEDILFYSYLTATFGAIGFGFYDLLTTTNARGIIFVTAGGLSGVAMLFNLMYTNIDDFGRTLIEVFVDFMREKIFIPAEDKARQKANQEWERLEREILKKNVTADFEGTRIELVYKSFADIPAEAYVASQYKDTSNVDAGTGYLGSKAPKGFAAYDDFAKAKNLEPGSVFVTKSKGEPYIIHLPIEGLASTLSEVRVTETLEDVKQRMQAAITSGLYKGLLQARHDGVRHISIASLLTFRITGPSLSYEQSTEAILKAISQFNQTNLPFERITFGVYPGSRFANPVKEFMDIESTLSKRSVSAGNRCLNLFN